VSQLWVCETLFKAGDRKRKKHFTMKVVTLKESRPVFPELPLKISIRALLKHFWALMLMLVQSSMSGQVRELEASIVC